MERSFLNQAIGSFIESNERNLQLDIFRKNGEVLLQMFKQSDVTKWGLDIKVADDMGFVVQLLFHKNKTGNKESYQRFLESNCFNDFKKIDFHGQNAYFMGIPSGVSLDVIEEKLHKILSRVYSFNDDSFDVTLNAY